MNTLKDAISMLRQKVRNLISAIEQGKASDDEFAMLKRLVEKRDRDAAHATVAPVDTAQYCSPCPLTPEIPSDVCVHMEKKEAGMMDPEQDQLESPSAGTGFETPGQQYPPNGETWETGRTITEDYLLVVMGSKQGGDTSPPTERADTRAGTATTPANSSNTIFLKASRKPDDKDKASEENKQIDPGGKGEKPPPWNAAVMVLFSFLGGTLGHGRLAVCASCSLSVWVCLSVHNVLFYQVIMFSELKNMRGDADQVADVRNRRAGTFLPINPLKIAKTNNTRFGRRKRLGIDLIWFGSFATRCSLVAISC